MGRSIGEKKAEDTQVPATWNWNEIRKCAHLLLDRMAASLGFFSPEVPLSFPGSRLYPAPTHSLGCPMLCIFYHPLPKGVHQKLIRFVLPLHSVFGAQLIGIVMGMWGNRGSLAVISWTPSEDITVTRNPSHKSELSMG